MRRRSVIYAFLAGMCCFTASAGLGVYSSSARFALEQWRSGKAKARWSGEVSAARMPVTIQTRDIAALEAAGVKVGTQVGDWVTAWVTCDSLGMIGEIPGVTYIEADNVVYPTLDKALPDIGYDAVSDSPILPMPYTGKGVIVGVVDIGFQWDHAAFRRADGSTRIAAAWNQNDSTGTPPDGYIYGSLFDTEEEIFAAHPCAIETHATHVASIAAGSSFGENPYGGVAREAELVLVDALHTPDGGIYTEGIIDGIRFICDYAAGVGKPCVINLSIGGRQALTMVRRRLTRCATACRAPVCCWWVPWEIWVRIIIIWDTTSTRRPRAFAQDFVSSGSSCPRWICGANRRCGLPLRYMNIMP